MKKCFVFAAFAYAISLQAQLGVGTENPKNTLEVHKSAADVSNTGSASNGHLRIGGSLGTTVLDMGISNSSESAWLQSRQSDDYSSTQTIRLQPNGGNIAIGSTTTPNEALTVTGNIKASGYVRGASNGQVLNYVLLNASDLSFSATQNYSATGYSDVISYTYTPVSSSSKIWVKYDCYYGIFGSATSGSDDECESVVTVSSSSGSGTLQSKRQRYGQCSGCGARRSMLFPISGVYSQSGGNALTFKVQVRKISGDDAVSVYPDMVLTIMEIAQ